MTNEDKKLIVKYMGWKLPCEGNIYHAAICAIDADSFCIACEFHHPFDLNDAGLCVQEMQKRGDWEYFVGDIEDTLIYTRYHKEHHSYKAVLAAWLLNAENFFKAFVEWRKIILKEKVEIPHLNHHTLLR